MSIQQNNNNVSLTWDGQGLTVGGTPGVSTAGVTFSILGWIKSLNNSGGNNFVNLYGEGITTDTSFCDVGMRTTGALFVFYRPAGSGTSISFNSTSTGWD